MSAESRRVTAIGRVADRFGARRSRRTPRREAEFDIWNLGRGVRDSLAKEYA